MTLDANDPRRCRMLPPATPKKPLRETRHGIEVDDPYRSLEDAADPATRGWLAAQRAHGRAVLDAIPGRAAAEARLKPRVLAEVAGHAMPWNGMLLLMKRRPGDEQSCLFLREGAAGRDVLLVDPLGIDPDGHVSIEVQALGRRLIAIAVREGGRDEAQTWFLDPIARRWDEWRLPEARRHDLRLLSDDSIAAWLDRADDPPKLCLSARGLERPPTAIRLRRDTEARFDRGWFLQNVAGRWTARRMESPDHVVPLELPEFAYRPRIVEGGVLARISYVGGGDELVLAKGELGALKPWRTLVAARPWPIGEVHEHAGHLLVEFIEEGTSVLRTFTLDGSMRHVTRVPGFGSLSPAGTLDDPPAILLHANSWTSPPEILALDLSTGIASTLWRSPQPPLRRDVVTRKITYSSRDGVRIPAWVAHGRDVKPDGNRPVLLLGYGGFGVVMSPRFSPLIAEWLDLGGVVMLPALRGGGEMGRAWSRQARGQAKQRTFDDFIAAAEWLVKERWSGPGRIAVRGGSNGGLTCGALITQRPDLAAAAILRVPLLDMARYDIGQGWWLGEYGDPSDPDDFRALMEYSPLHAVRDGTAYPAVLLVTGSDDTRVPPWHARKMAAALQSASSSGRPVLLHDEERHGHSGTASATNSLRREADELAFLAWQLGVPLG